MKLDTQLLHSMLDGKCTITKNQLLAEQLHKLFLKHCLAHNIQFIEKPMILSIEDWIARLCQQSLREDPPKGKRLLNSMQSEGLWRKVMKLSSISNPEKAQLAYQAWKVCQLSSTDYPVALFMQHSNQWQQWALQFEHQCRLQGWIDQYHYLGYLMQEGRLKAVGGSHKICLVGFSTGDSYYQVLFKYLSKKGYVIQRYLTATATEPLAVETHCSSNSYSELYTIAQQAWEYWKENPEKSIGCAIFNLKASRDATVMAFQTVYHSIFYDASDQHYPLSLPLENCPFSHHPVIQTAIDILMLQLPSFELAALSRLLRTAYIACDISEQASNTQLETNLRRQYSLALSFETFMQYASHHRCFTLVSIFKEWEQHYRSTLHKEQSCAAWADYFRVQLQTWNWATLADLSCEEIYYLNLLQQALDKFASLDLLHAHVDYHTALQTLLKHIESISCPLQIEAPQHGIYLIDIEEAALFAWDKLWVMYANHHNRFNTLSQNPFIPFALQGKGNSNQYLTLLKQVLHTSNATTVSISEEEYVQTHQQLAQWVEIPITECQQEASAHVPLFSLMNDAIQWEYYSDHQAPHLDSTHTYQEARLLQTQSLCPFRAFSDYRLGLKQHSLSWPGQAISYAQKSQLLYHLLAKLWSAIQTQTQLKSLSNKALDRLLTRIIHNETNTLIQKQSWIWQPTFTQIEKERLHKLLTKYLEIEKTRPSFQVIGIQQLQTYCIGTLQLTFTLDRVDQEQNGEMILLHYKANTKLLPYHEWIDNGAFSFQLALCALSESNAIKALSYLQFRPDHQIKFYGMSQENTSIPGIYPLSGTHAQEYHNSSWEQLFEFWNHQLKDLAKQFTQGVASVKPKEGLKTCQKCQYGLLCRIKEIHAMKKMTHAG